MIGLVNVINTTAPEDVEKEIENLLSEYNSKINWLTCYLLSYLNYRKN